MRREDFDVGTGRMGAVSLVVVFVGRKITRLDHVKKK
jgi:hypothetical protein